MKIIKNKSLSEYLSKYGYAYNKGRVISIDEKEVENFKHKYSEYVFNGKKYKLDEKSCSLLKEKGKYYLIDNKYYQVPLFSKKGFTGICCAGIVAALFCGSVGGHYIYIGTTRTTAQFGTGEVANKIVIKGDTKPLIGNEYSVEIQVKEEAKAERYMPSKLKSVVTGSRTLEEYHKEQATYSSCINDTNSTEPDNYYTYTISDDRSKGNLFIKKVEGPVTVDFGLSQTEDLTITAKPTQLRYLVDEKFNKQGIEVKAKKIGGTEQIVTDKITINYDNHVFVNDDVGVRKVEVNYDDYIKTFDIWVGEPQILSITALPKTIYEVNESIDLTGIKARAAYYFNGAFIDLNESDLAFKLDGVPFTSYTFTNEDVGKLKTLTISYKDKVSKNIYVGVPIDCNNPSDFLTKYNDNNNKCFRLKKLTDETGYPYYLPATSRNDGSNIMILGEDNTVKVSLKDGGGVDQTWGFRNMNVVLKDMTIVPIPTNVNQSDNLPGFLNYLSAIFDNVIFDKCCYQYWGVNNNDYSKNLTNVSSFFNCKFNADTSENANEYLLWTYTGTFEFNNCEFNGKKKWINFYHTEIVPEVKNFYRATFSDCTFTAAIDAPLEDAKPVFNLKDNYQASSDPSLGVVLNIINCDFTNTISHHFETVGSAFYSKDESPSIVYQDKTHIFGKDYEFIIK